MAQKINPKALRLGIIKNWDSRWFPKRKSFSNFLEEDFRIRDFLRKTLKTAGVESIVIERLSNNININIATARPGVIIGRGGKGVELLKKNLEKIIKKNRRDNSIDDKFALLLNIEEVKAPTASAMVVAQMVAEDLEKRMPFRRVMKRMIEQVNKNRGVEGVKIKVSGRLGGADIARSETLDSGKMPLQTLRADIDYAQARAVDSFGTIGIKVWIYKGEVFDQEKGGEVNNAGQILRPARNQ